MQPERWCVVLEKFNIDAARQGHINQNIPKGRRADKRSGSRGGIATWDVLADDLLSAKSAGEACVGRGVPLERSRAEKDGR